MRGLNLKAHLQYIFVYIEHRPLAKPKQRKKKVLNYYIANQLKDKFQRQFERSQLLIYSPQSHNG